MLTLEPLLGRTLILVAHPDDEAVGCGALLQRIRDPLVIFATDGGPRDPFFWKEYGSREAYVETRRGEARDALGIAGVHQFEFLTGPGGEPLRDQELYLNIADALAALAAILERDRPEALLTLAYEGGHPDHDTCNFLSHVISRQRQLGVWEMPLYHRSAEGLMVGPDFRVSQEEEVVLRASAEEMERKRRMVAAYRSQKGILDLLTSDIERFRPLQAYDYGKPPHPGTLNYEAWQWSMTGADLVGAFAPFLAQESSAARRHPSGDVA